MPKTQTTTSTASSPSSQRSAALSALLGPGNFSRIADSTGLSRAHVSRVLRGKARASLPVAKQIAEATSLTLADLDTYIESYTERRCLPDTRDPDRSSTRPVTDSALGARIRKQREARGWTQDELAREVGGIDSTYVSKIEHGRRVPPLGTLQKILGVLAGEGGADTETGDEEGVSTSPPRSSSSSRSNLATFPSFSPPPGSLHPSSYRPDFDVVYEIEHNRERYSGAGGGESQSWISIYQLPSTFRTSLDRIRAACEGNKPGINPTIACCIAYGLDILRSHPSVSSLLGIRVELFRMEALPSRDFAAEFEELANFMRNFYFTIPDHTSGSSSKMNVALPEHLKSALCDMADELGTSLSAISTLCIGLALRDQPEVMPVRRKELEASLEAFFDGVELRYRVAKVWLATLREQRMKAASQ